MKAPWPEEFNRRVTSLTAGLHCAPTERSAQNLRNEGIDAATVHVTGNTVIDALLWAADRERGNDSQWKEKYASLGDARVVLITGHRRENFGGWVRKYLPSDCATRKTIFRNVIRLPGPSEPERSGTGEESARRPGKRTSCSARTVSGVCLADGSKLRHPQ